MKKKVDLVKKWRQPITFARHIRHIGLNNTIQISFQCFTLFLNLFYCLTEPPPPKKINPQKSCYQKADPLRITFGYLHKKQI